VVKEGQKWSGIGQNEVEEVTTGFKKREKVENVN
jgi:hypothetical protein